MSDLTRKLAIFSCLLFTGFCFWKAGAGLIGGADTEILPSAQAAISPSFSPPRVVTTPIQQMRPGGDWRVKRTHFGAEMGPTWGWVNHVG
ncbi:hypothetical protein Pan161_15090 [Gimesia algae]|uniref:Uncharacterized protein n=1 Tax=Gimesia algae TaxID=2527971 RepID=A0A517VA50_9PLAN|nr:hypothetical protein Pan161_15090 [Gimesia algae]